MHEHDQFPLFFFSPSQMKLSGDISYVWVDGKRIPNGHSIDLHSNGEVMVDQTIVAKKKKKVKKFPPFKVSISASGDLRIIHEQHDGSPPPPMRITLIIPRGVHGNLYAPAGTIEVRGDVEGSVTTNTGSIVVDGYVGGAATSGTGTVLCTEKPSKRAHRVRDEPFPSQAFLPPEPRRRRQKPLTRLASEPLGGSFSGVARTIPHSTLQVTGSASRNPNIVIGGALRDTSMGWTLPSKSGFDFGPRSIPRDWD